MVFFRVYPYLCETRRNLVLVVGFIKKVNLNLDVDLDVLRFSK